MLHKVCERLNSINSFSKKIIKYGCIFSFILCMMGATVVAYNQIALSKIALYNIGTSMVYTSIVAFSQFVIGGLLIDFFGVLLSNHE